MSLFTVDVFHYIKPDPAVQSQLDRIEQKLDQVLSQGVLEMAGMQDVQDQLDALNQKVTDQESVQQSAVTLLQGLKSALDAALATSDPTAALAQIKSISDRIGSDTQALSDAVVANTPAA